MSRDQGSVYTAFIEEQLKAELSRRTSLDERGSKLQQSASVTVGLFVAALGMLLGKDQHLTGGGLTMFVVTVALLVVSFLGGVVTTVLFRYRMATPSTLKKMLAAEHWIDTEITSRNFAAWLNVTTLERLRPGNNVKALALTCGIVAQGLGVIAGVITFGLVAAGLLWTPAVP
ncbi:hypothetical protein LKO27_03410 [Tessaracoccus sp. OS52]|uniref:hypothetical protein n=1 Tax=Tessaracoccus sp. OS52 TaxID=2886691 RepID=UPI001D12B8F5|nr:hypothetical protein [Tessaracoccus sp. OS52]MCC2592471.1 hypothetical protein [Tessaracoccus sp. OS52]